MKSTPWTETISADGIEVTVLRDSYYPMTLPVFRGASGERLKELLPQGAIWSPVLGFLIRCGEKHILIDAGWGEGHGFLIRLLKESGVTPGEIDAVLLTHMHFDHIGGLLTFDGKAAFPNAVIRVSEPEYRFWKGFPPAEAELAHKVFAAYGDKLQIFHYNDTLECGILACDAAGHTPGHTIYELGNFSFIGDIVHVAKIQFPEPDITAFFEDQPAAIANRKKFLSQAAEQKRIICGAHLPYPGIGTVCFSGKGFQLELQGVHQ